MIKYDYHIHTNFSSDSEAPMEDVIKKAITAGLKEIAITDHWDYIYPDKFFPHQINYDEYIIIFNNLKEKYKDQLKILFGVEIGVGPHLGSAVSNFVKKYEFDFVIGSIHDIRGEDLYFGNYFDGLSKEEAYTGYFQYILDSIKNIKDFCVFGHLDFISRYGNYTDPYVHYDELSDIIDQVLIELITRGKGIEINTSGYRYGINSVYPQMSVLKRYKELGGQIITIGSDAHKPVDIAKDFDKAYEFLKQSGFNHINIFRNGKPEFIAI